MYGMLAELIDTLWNVNKYGYLMFDKATGELIDTLWNVNRYPLCGWSRAGWINRYIMECRYTSKTDLDKSIQWINRYIMECKYIFHN